MHLIKKLIVGGGKVSARLEKRVQDLDTEIYETYGMTETITHVAARQINFSKNQTEKIPFRAMKKVKFEIDDRDCLIINAPKLSEEPIFTNDIVKLISHKKFFWKGRFDRVINSGGIKIFPEQVERKLEPFISRRFFITGLPHDSLGERVVLFIESDFSEDALKDLEDTISSAENLSKYQRPRKIYFVEKFEETHTGKIHRINTAQAKRD
jgi:O-succinylbenzoic acid--CoA ligase